MGAAGALLEIRDVVLWLEYEHLVSGRHFNGASRTKFLSVFDDTTKE